MYPLICLTIGSLRFVLFAHKVQKVPDLVLKIGLIAFLSTKCSDPVVHSQQWFHNFYSSQTPCALLSASLMVDISHHNCHNN